MAHIATISWIKYKEPEGYRAEGYKNGKRVVTIQAQWNWTLWLKIVRKQRKL